MYDNRIATQPSTFQSWLAALGDTLRRRHGTVVIAAILAAAGAILTSATGDPVFRSEAVVTTLYDRGGSAPGLAAPGTGRALLPGLDQLVSAPRGRLFPLVLGSRRATRRVMKSSYRYQIDGAPIVSDLYDYLGIRNPDVAEIAFRSRVVAFRLDPSTGATTIRADTKSPELSRQIVQRCIETLEETLNEFREQGIQMRLAVIAEKLATAKRVLGKNEQLLRRLRDKNRDYASALDPRFYLRQLQIEREIELGEQMVVALKSHYELTMSRLLDRDGRLTVVSPPALATICQRPRWGASLWLATVAGGLFAFLTACALTAVESIGPARRKRWLVLARMVGRGLDGWPLLRRLVPPGARRRLAP